MPTYLLGRDFETPIKIDSNHTSVSHNHASLTIEGNSWTLTDNNSTNGTFIEENGKFRRYQSAKVTPDMWIRLGAEDHTGYCFKARRVLKPNNYQEDFAELVAQYQEFERIKDELESRRRTVKFITPILMIIALAVSFVPGISGSGMALRASFLLPGFFSPIIQEFYLRKLEVKIKRMQDKFICPKCRRPLGKNDIINREHTICHAK